MSTKYWSIAYAKEYWENILRLKIQPGKETELLFRKHWPLELDRICPKHWPTELQIRFNHCIPETKLYGYFREQICGHPLLQHDGKQLVHLQQRIVGNFFTETGHPVAIGEPGEPDLQGGMTLYFDLVSQLKTEIRIGIEIKKVGNVQQDLQKKRQTALQARGSFYYVAYTVEDAVKALIDHSNNLRLEIYELYRNKHA